MNIRFQVKAINDNIDVYIMVNDKTVSITSYKASDDIEATIPLLLEKAKSNSIRALALENALNAQLKG